MKKTEYKTALVTGAASGLGFEFSLLLAADNYNLVMVDIEPLKLEKAKNHIEKQSPISIMTLVKDLSQQNIAIEIFKSLDVTIDVLVNNAGFGLFGPFNTTNWQRESDMLNLHINTTTQLTKLALKFMVEQGHGRILNVASLAAFQPGPLMSIYYASKAYILSFSRAISNELKGSGVTVTALCPGQTKTGFQEVVSESAAPNKIKMNIADAKAVAKFGYNAMLKGKTIAIPGIINRLFAFATRFIPRDTVTSIVRKLQEKNRSKQLNYGNF
ncbi:SDR family NAD(P)-dependent oxidoreductase [Seonamhaeicola maritimus]|uniref:SDR family oxidoreductase n=1 Tax=Seonamhaeicola maritimus TaxID=2591822 RepID=A0A5C7GK20_9FLAO|nr:SDR family oxidoreductase [Seonamhaeicola maritimus]TXG38663.1 SDR family oxidoreductase [Seonamhaeicola maritimus]